MGQGVQSDPQGRGLDWGAVIFGVILLGIGGYLLLKDTLKIDVPDISWGEFWPVILIAIGVVVLIRSARGDRWRDR